MIFIAETIPSNYKTKKYCKSCIEFLSFYIFCH